MTRRPPAAARRLLNAPKPFADEAVSSWLNRLALSQGSTLREILRHLRISPTGDVDAIVIGSQLEDVRGICGLSETDLTVHDRVMSNLTAIGALGDGMLLLERGRYPQTYFCRECIDGMRTPYFPIHWRFAAWQWCPTHDRLMDIACPNCNISPRPMRELLTSPAGKIGFAALNRCRNCGAALNMRPGKKCQSDRLSDLPPDHQRKLLNGRALLSALYHGWFRTKWESTKISIKGLGGLASRDDFVHPRSSQKPLIEMRSRPLQPRVTAQRTFPPSKTPSQNVIKYLIRSDEDFEKAAKIETERHIHVRLKVETFVSNERQTVGTNEQQAVTFAMLECASHLGLEDYDLADVLGVTPSSIIGYRYGEMILTSYTAVWRRTLCLIEVCNSLIAVIGDDKELARSWLRSPNKSFHNRAPLELLVDPDESAVLLEYLVAHRHRT